MTEAEARKIFDLKISLCDVLGLDVKTACIDAGVPADMVDKFVRADKALTAATARLIRDPSVLALEQPVVTRKGNGRPGERDREFTCLSQKSTGLAMIIWIMAKGISQKIPHIRVQANHSNFPQITSSVCVSIEEQPRLAAGSGIADGDLKDAIEFVRQNRVGLLAHWRGTTDSFMLVKKIARAD